MDSPITFSTIEHLEARILFNVAPLIGPLTNQSTAEGTAVHLTATFTDPDAGDAHTAQIDWGDGSVPAVITISPSSPTLDPLDPAGTIDATHMYADNGSYTAIVTVTDTAAASDSKSFTATIMNTSPTLTISGSHLSPRNATYTLSLWASDPGNDTIDHWQINWGDGNNQTVTGNPSSVDHVYSNAGYFVITASATDEDGTYNANSWDVATASIAAPDHLTAAPSGQGASSGNINLAWTDESTNETGFQVQYSTNNTYWYNATTANANQPWATVYSYAANATYYFRVQAYNSDGASAYSNVATVSPNTVNLPSTPAGVYANYDADGEVMMVGWTDITDNEQGYKIEQSTDGGTTWSQVATAGQNAQIWSTSGLTAGTTYSFRVRAYNTGGDSEYSNTSSVAMPPAIAPYSLSATYISSSRVDLSWYERSSSTNETGFQIERSTDGVSFSTVGTTTANVHSFSDSGVSPGTTYLYRVRATTVNSVITLEWFDNATNESQYLIEKSTDNVNFTQVVTV